MEKPPENPPINFGDYQKRKKEEESKKLDDSFKKLFQSEGIDFGSMTEEDRVKIVKEAEEFIKRKREEGNLSPEFAETLQKAMFDQESVNKDIDTKNDARSGKESNVISLKKKRQEKNGEFLESLGIKKGDFNETQVYIMQQLRSCDDETGGNKFRQLETFFKTTGEVNLDHHLKMLRKLNNEDLMKVYRQSIPTNWRKDILFHKALYLEIKRRLGD